MWVWLLAVAWLLGFIARLVRQLQLIQTYHILMASQGFTLHILCAMNGYVLNTSVQ